MSEQRVPTLLNFPSVPTLHAEPHAPGAALESDADEALLRDIAPWTVPSPSDESRERLLASARAELVERALIAAAVGKQPRLILPQRSGQRWPIVATLSAAVAVIVSFWWSAATVSADEALSRAQQAEAGRWSSVPEPVLHQRIELRVATNDGRHRVQWESWADAAGTVHHVSTDRPAQRPIVTRYLDTLTRNGLDTGPPISATAFARWRRQLPAGGGRTEHVELVQSTATGPVFRIHVQAPAPRLPGRIVEASVLLRASDWHPIEQVLHVQTSEGGLERFDLIEHDVTVVPRDAVPETRADEPARVQPADSPAPGPSATPSAEELRDVEVQALFALHQLHADLGEQIDVTRRSEYVEVGGVADTEDRLAAITGVISQIPHTRVTLLQAGSAASTRGTRQSVFDTSPRVPDGPAAAAAADDPPLWRFVDAYLQSGQADARAPQGDTTARVRAVNVFVQEVNGEAEDAVAEAWALRRLTERYPHATRESLAEPSRRRLEEMTGNHLTSIRVRLVRLRRALEAVAIAARHDRTSEGLVEREPPSAVERPVLSGPQVFLEVIDVERQLSRLLVWDRDTGFAGDDDDAVLLQLARLLSLLTRLDHDLQLLLEQA